jgi:hypothetical protein
MKKMMIAAAITAMFTLCTTNAMYGRAKIPFGKADKIEMVADLPNTDEFKITKMGSRYYDLGRLHQEFNIAWIIPAYVTQEPKLVLFDKEIDNTYYELTDEQLNKILADNKLEKDKL